jgi:antibiotic biosynthesis monooxygenase (ABM) superfamily enzyme
MMFAEHVPPAKVADYEKWSAGIHGDAKRYEGFISVDVIRPGEGDGLEYTTLVKFDSCDNLKRWRDSTSLANWVVDLPELTVPLGPQDYRQHQQAE